MISEIISSLKTSDILPLLIVFTIIYVANFYHHHFTRPNPLPGPIPIPILGNACQLFGIGFNDFLTSMHKKYGDIYDITLGGQRMIVVCRPDLIENMHIPSTKTKYPFRFHLRPGITEYHGLGDLGMFNNNNYQSWKFNRQFFTQAMMTPSFNHQAVEWAIESWEQMEYFWNKLGENHELDLAKWIHRFTNDMIFRVSTGVNPNSVSSYYQTLINNLSLSEKEKENIEDSERFVQSVETFLIGTLYFSTFNKYIRYYLPFFRSKTDSLLKNRDYLFGKLYNIIKQRRIEIEVTPSDQPLCHDMLTSYITANTPRDINVTKNVDAKYLRPMTDEEILGNLIDTMMAGTDTTSNMFCFIIYYLEHYPEVKHKLRQELERVFEKDLKKPITFKDLDKLQYCDAVIKEVFRHFPVVFMMSRLNTEDDKVGEYNWQKGTEFTILYSAILKHKDHWTDPEKFDPDRFYKVKECDKYLLEQQQDKNSFTMWGGGTRICPGRKLAVIELKCLLASIYRKYDIELVLDMDAPIKCKSVAINVIEELIVKIKPLKV